MMKRQYPVYMNSTITFFSAAKHKLHIESLHPLHSSSAMIELLVIALLSSQRTWNTSISSKNNTIRSKHVMKKTVRTLNFSSTHLYTHIHREYMYMLSIQTYHNKNHSSRRFTAVLYMNKLKVLSVVLRYKNFNFI